MRIKDYFPTNVLELYPMRVMCFTTEKVEQNKMYLWDDSITDCNDIEYFEITRDMTNACCYTMRDISMLAHILSTIEDNPLLPDAILEQLVQELPWGVNTTIIGKEQLRVDLHLLYLLFICYKHLIWEVSSSSIDIFWRNKMKLLVPQMVEISPDASFRELCVGCMQSFEVTGESAELSFSVADDGTTTRVLSCSDVRTAFWYAIMLYIDAYKHGTAGWEIAICKNCKNEYMRENRRFELCESCREGKNRTKACRQRKKEAAHANENHS